MSELLQGFIASIAVVGGLCTLIYWVFSIVEKRLEIKVDNIGADIQRIANELREERRSKDHLYKFVMDHVKKVD